MSLESHAKLLELDRPLINQVLLPSNPSNLLHIIQKMEANHKAQTHRARSAYNLKVKKNRELLESNNLIGMSHACITPLSPSKSPKSRPNQSHPRIHSEIGKAEPIKMVSKRTQAEVDPKSQFITQMFGTTSVLHPRRPSKERYRDVNLSQDLKLVVQEKPDLKHYDHDYSS